ncbi:hypothetical protein niasHS_011916 [Heterodera schachtii]|uniref:Helitron helicase-like domain-containing protein n=1 Tax=Heterodera schachtii TaxID=97005 RepID=A0ABD2IS20_HETSC
MPSKDRRRKELERSRWRMSTNPDNDDEAEGGPRTNLCNPLDLTQEPSTSNAIGTQTIHSGDEDSVAPLTKKIRGDGVGRRVNLRIIELNLGQQKKWDQRMAKVILDYMQRPWPSNTPSRTRRRSATFTQHFTRCGDDCDCASYAPCQQNASAFIACSDYFNQFKHGIMAPKPFKRIHKNDKWGRPSNRCHQNNEFKCGARSAGHRVDYYDSGQFGDFSCQFCGARLLRGEHEKIMGGRQTPCCANGALHTQQMQYELDELLHPQNEFLAGLVETKDERLREAFLNNLMAFNNTFAFASTHGEKAPAEQMGGRMDTCKYNGEFSFMFSDLIAPGGRRPTFAQVYTLSPEAAMEIREQTFDNALAQHVKTEIVQRLEKLMRDNPFGKTFETVGTKVEAVKATTGDVPRFKIVLLTDRDLKSEAIKNRGDVTVIERADAPTAKQVAVIWVQEDGLPPQISADKAGKMRELKNGMPQLDPCCFPLLHPRGTLGWRWFLTKRGCAKKILDKSPADNFIDEDIQQVVTSESTDLQLQIQNEFNQSFLNTEDEDIIQQVGTLDNFGLQEMPEPECDLDGEQMQEQVTSVGIRVGTSAQETGNNQEEDPIFETEVQMVERGRNNISERQFYRYRMALRGDDKNSFHWLWFARRLAEYFTITVLNRIERNELDHLKEIQRKKNYRRILAREYITAMEKGLQKCGPNAKLGSVFLMPQNFAGSRQYYQGKYADLMTMVRHLGAPTWFVTFTGNPKWPEISEALRGRQNYVHRPDIVCRIFMDKATEFIKDVTERCVLGKVAGWCYSVEHQKRGMPHIHMLLILEKGGRLTTPEQVDEYVCARIPMGMNELGVGTGDADTGDNQIQANYDDSDDYFE